MKGEYNWNMEKKDLKNIDVKILHEKLKDVEKEKMKLETDMYRKNGSSVKIRNYPLQKQTKPYGNINYG